jgi:hypothetical protein
MGTLHVLHVTAVMLQLQVMSARFVMEHLCHDFDVFQLCSPFGIRVLALLFAFQRVKTCCKHVLE